MTIKNKSPEDPKEPPLKEHVRKIRKFDCGAWLKDGELGRSKRIELMKLLDDLYSIALQDRNINNKQK